ncbi:MAG: cytochrome c, partial [Zoogloeaceae bacterium]|nr:cytochrome c [Zoogloeaceae bacterium]
MGIRWFLLFFAFLFVGCGDVEDTRPGRPVARRQAAFREMLQRFEPMGIQLREGTYTADVFRRQAEALANMKAVPWDHFGPDTQYPPSKSDDRLWREPDIFAAEREEFMRAAESLRLAAQDAP